MTKPETVALAEQIAEEGIPPELEEMLRWRDEPLDPELEEYLEETTFGQSVRHPLCYAVPLFLPGEANKRLRMNKDRLAEAVDANDAWQMVFIHERAYRCNALIDYVTGYDEFGLPLALDYCDEATRELAAHVWTDSENIHQFTEEWTYLFEGKGWLMGDREAFDAMPDPITIYRGDIEDGGWSWTTDLKIAKWFAQRLGATDDLVYATVAKEHVFAYLPYRNESEILVRLDAPINITKRVPYETWSKEQ